MTTPARNPKIPAEVSYPVISDEHDNFPPNYRRIVGVRLNMKVSPEVLREIALEVKSSDSQQYERTLVFCYLPEKIFGLKNPPWATTHFDPTLEVKIQGLTMQDEESLRKTRVEHVGETIGSWVFDTQLGGNLAVIYEDNGPKLALVYPDKVRNDSPMIEFPAQSGRRFQVKDSTEFYDIDSSGVLRLMAADGRVFAGALPRK